MRVAPAKRPESDETSGLRSAVALVTGGGRGLGEAICRALASEGATVVAGDVRDELASEVASSLERGGLSAESIHLDVTDGGSAEDAVASIVERHGGIDVLVNNAGTDLTAPFEEITQAEWDRIIAVNLGGPALMSRVVFPHMRRERRGHIVNVVSTAAKRAWANASAYHASKWGLLGLSHALHVEGRPFGIKVTAVVAGGMRTPFLLDRFPDLDPSTLQDPANVAATVRFVLTQPAETVIPEVMVIPMTETSWP
jgi:NAD(P)-dependent dehydrogenase (short-subunit alcohol dehydrogenase family)